ncbi:hypothetical protein [Paenibacillus odorifer]|uniref:hypothetical protein n=1 Tax=Paenibacillus odorifer TaxID=189426 RepID=UPI0020BE8696|nr:hypothetical protein [Paenibacillus odorifer]
MNKELHCLIFSENLDQIALMDHKFIPPFIDNTKPYKYLTEENRQNTQDAFNFLRTVLDIRPHEILYYKEVMKVTTGKHISIYSFVVEGTLQDVNRSPNIPLWVISIKEIKQHLIGGFTSHEVYRSMLDALDITLRIFPKEINELLS